MLPICGKIFEILIFNSLFECSEESKLLSIHQYGFLSNDSCVNHLLLLVYNLKKDFDAEPILEFRDMFLEMSNTFEKVWQHGIIFKLKSVGVLDSVLNLVETFLSYRFHRVLLNGQTSEWLPVKASVPQGSILGHFFPNLH